ncbi:MAG: RsmB/NOP family class I SAM-dependent RNA methyltransferase [Dysgonamonadaceae bacterium]|nr:RsmB/NOP family class I SAM-dependent RNA methyltransferase [Dysgonamonadaceae bacterium]
MELPAVFVSRTQALLGSEWSAFECALNEESPVSIRLNPYKSSTETLNSFKNVEIVPWASNAYYLPYRPAFTFDPLFHAGCYYVQEASSMFLEQIIRKQISKPVKVLDLCAAPGGKSTQLASVLPERSLLVANEIIRPRACILTENLIKWGIPNTIITNNDPSTIGKLSACFDVIVADVPCSGEGMFRKDTGVINEWSIHAIQLCAERQKRIIADVWPALKQGGLLVYSTCTYNKEENEDVISWICKELKAEIADPLRRFMPHRTKGEGFFIATVRKTGGKEEKRKRKKEKGKKIQIPPEIKNRLTEWDRFSIFSENNSFTIIPAIHSEDYLFLKNRLKIISAGTTLGEIKGKDFVPAHAMAMSNFLASSAFPKWELDKETALKYLRRETLQTTVGNLPKGYILVTYLNHPLGFIKNIGIRTNNLYPQEWRIRASGKKINL